MKIIFFVLELKCRYFELHLDLKGSLTTFHSFLVKTMESIVHNKQRCDPAFSVESHLLHNYVGTCFFSNAKYFLNNSDISKYTGVFFIWIEKIQNKDGV